MTPDWVQATVAVVSLIIGILTVWLVWCQIESVRRQLKIQNFSEYTRRYQEFILHLPDNVNDESFDLQRSEMVGDRNKFMRYMRAYCDMCFDEFWLRRSGLLDKDIWSVWEYGMPVAFARRAFRQA
jgi:hypothetical protein